MHFSRKKLPKESIQALRRVPVGLCESQSILLTPVYVYLPMNQKFVAIKAPLQNFSQAELEKFKPYENFYLPEFIDQIAPFQKAGEAIRNLLAIKQKSPIRTSKGNEISVLPITPHELDDATLRLVGPLWNEGAKVEPFFLCFFANEVCNPVDVQKMMAAIDQDADLFELALLRASSAVFLALHIGYSDSKTLTLLRDSVFDGTMSGAETGSNRSELVQMTKLIREFIPTTEAREISLEGIQKILAGPTLMTSAQRVTRKLASRLTRVQAEFIRPGAPVASLYSDKGIRDG